ncbi:hypothetical protein GF360_01875 [candidate division WWE3 bacterium]|nr:hypothetical protein [candidate division WWE3 bacterium]
MLLTPHTMVGIAIGATTQNPLLTVPLSIASHFAGDLVPHWDFYSNTKKEERIVGWRPLALMADIALGIAIGLTTTLYALWVLKNPMLAINVFLGGVGAVLPDVIEAPHIYMKEEPKFVEAVAKVQSRLQFQAPLPWGIISQVLVMLISFLISANSLGL